MRRNPSHSSSVAVAVLLLLASLTSRYANAQTVDELIDQGVEYRRQNKHDRALELFQRAHAQAASPRTLAQMGLAEQSLLRWLDAENHLTSALANHTFPWIIRNRGPLEQALAAVRRHIGQLIIRGRPSGANVYVNSQPRGTLPLPLPIRLPEGDAAVQITAPGHQPDNQVVRIPPQGSEAIDVVLEPVSLAPKNDHSDKSSSILGRTSESPPPGGWGVRKIAGVSLLVASISGGATGITFLVLHGKPTCDRLPPGVQCESIRDTRLLGWSVIAASGAAAAGGGFLLYQRTRTNVSLAVTPTALIATGRF